jgi:hypothetical protein
MAKAKGIEMLDNKTRSRSGKQIMQSICQDCIALAEENNFIARIKYSVRGMLN